MENYIRFDWAMKRLLRNKANYAVLEGLLTTLLEEKVTIHRLLEGYAGGEFERGTGTDRGAEQQRVRVFPAYAVRSVETGDGIHQPGGGI